MANLSALVMLSSLVCFADSASFVISECSLLRTIFRQVLSVSGLLVRVVFRLNCLSLYRFGWP